MVKPVLTLAALVVVAACGAVHPLTSSQETVPGCLCRQT